jgi:S-adenosylmethionine hydrolase
MVASERPNAKLAASQMTRPFAFLSDFGYRNEWVGICHAVIDKIAPESHVIDLSHGIPPLDVRAGALLLVRANPGNAGEGLGVGSGDVLWLGPERG